MVTAKQFYPGIIEYSERMSAGYNSGRALSAAAAQEHVASSVVERIELLVFENDRCENVV
jgi:hypothetical protein